MAAAMPREGRAGPSGLQRAASAAAGAVGLVSSTIALALAYLVGVALAAVAARLCGKRFLDLGPEPGAPTYWEPSSLAPEPEGRCLRRY